MATIKLIEIVSDFDEFKEIDEVSESEILGKYICKVYIRNEDREGCLRALRRMNVHHASLFPDLLGASDYCNILIEEAERERAIARAEAQQAAAAKAPEKVASEQEVVDAESPLAGTDHTANLVDVLTMLPERAQVEPGRIQLIANQLATELDRHKVVDWDRRETVQAKLRNVTRVILRKYGYPVSIRDQQVCRDAQDAKRDIPVPLSPSLVTTAYYASAALRIWSPPSLQDFSDAYDRDRIALVYPAC